MRIDIWSDVVCPWCYIGFTRLEQVVAAAGEPVEVRHHAFQLDPDAVGVESTVAQLGRKYGRDEADVRVMMDRVTREAASVGLNYRLAETKSGNTLLAHRLLAAAADAGVGHLLLQRLFSAYFQEAQEIFSAADLRPHGLAVGMPPELMEQVLAGDAYEAEVAEDIAMAEQLGITSVPFFVFEGRIGLPGAVSAEVLTAAMKQAAAGV